MPVGPIVNDTLTDEQCKQIVSIGSCPPTQPAQELVSFTATPMQVPNDGVSTTKVAWETRNASRVLIDGYQQELTGELIDKPLWSPRQYTITVEGAAKPIEDEVIVELVATPPPADLCAGQATARYDAQWGRGDMNPAFNAQTTLVVAVTVPASPTSYSTPQFAVSIAEHQGSPTTRRATLSRFACDFREKDPTGANGPISVSTGNTATVRANVGADQVLKPGDTVYVNVRNQFQNAAGEWEWSCSASSCPIIMGFTWPR